MPRKNNRKTDLTRKECISHVWRHNSFFGWARMMQSQCHGIINSPSTTPETKAIALRIENETKELIRQLKTRVDK